MANAQDWQKYHCDSLCDARGQRVMLLGKEGEKSYFDHGTGLEFETIRENYSLARRSFIIFPATQFNDDMFFVF